MPLARSSKFWIGAVFTKSFVISPLLLNPDLAVVVMDRRGVPAERGHGHVHEGKKRQAAQYFVQLGIARHVEDADVAVTPGNAPAVAPDGRALQFMTAGFLFGL